MTSGPLRGPRRHDRACAECGRTDCAGPHGDHHRVVGLEDALMRLIALLRSVDLHETACALTAHRRDYYSNMQAMIVGGEPMPDVPACDCILSTPTEPT